jgi:anti-sigma factor RsiW
MAESSEHITCQELVEVVTDYLDDALSADDAALVEQHVNFCQGCQWYVDEMRRTVAAGGQLKEDHVPKSTLDVLMAAFRDRGPS